MEEDSLALAGQIAAKSPLAIAGIKRNLAYSRDHGVADGLDYMATWNAGMLRAEDLMKAVQASMAKKEAVICRSPVGTRPGDLKSALERLQTTAAGCTPVTPLTPPLRDAQRLGKDGSALIFLPCQKSVPLSRQARTLQNSRRYPHRVRRARQPDVHGPAPRSRKWPV